MIYTFLLLAFLVLRPPGAAAGTGTGTATQTQSSSGNSTRTQTTTQPPSPTRTPTGFPNSPVFDNTDSLLDSRFFCSRQVNGSTWRGVVMHWPEVDPQCGPGRYHLTALTIGASPTDLSK